MRSPERSEAAWLGELKIGNCAPLDQFLLERDLHPSQTRGVPPESDLWADPPVDSASGLEVRRQRRAALKKEKKDTGQKKDGMLKVAGPAAALDSIPEEERGDDGEASQMILTDAAKESQRLQSAEAVRLQRLQSAEADRLQRLQSTEADRLQRPQSAEDAKVQRLKVCRSRGFRAPVTQGSPRLLLQVVPGFPRWSCRSSFSLASRSSSSAQLSLTWKAHCEVALASWIYFLVAEV